MRFSPVVAGWLAVWVAMFRVGQPTGIIGGKAPPPGVSYGPLRCAIGTSYCMAVRPFWTIPLAVAIAVAGIAVAVVVYRTRGGRGEARGVATS